MERTEYLQYDGTGLAELIQQKKVSTEEVIQASREQLQYANPAINALARDRFEAVEAELKHLPAYEDTQHFNGVPTVLKDLSQTIAKEENISGSMMFQGNIARNTSHLVEKILQAGCLPIGYSTTPEFGLKNITEAKVYGATRNPWNTDYSPGGSSGGSAALVAAGVVPIAGASDGGGSIRIPASFTGLFGLKPTRGRTSVGPGVGRQWQGAAVDFVLSRSVRDSARMLDHLQTVQEAAAFQTPLYTKGYEKSLAKQATDKLVIGYSLESPVGTVVSTDAVIAMKKVIRYLEELGHDVEEAAPMIDGKQLMRDYYMMNSGEMAALLSQIEMAKGSPIQANEVEMETWMLYTAGKKLTAADFSKSLSSWDMAAAKMTAYHEKYDFYLTPATAMTAPEIGKLTPSPEKEQAYKSEIESLDAKKQQELIYEMFLPSLTYTPFTQLANLTGQPAMSVPVHVSLESGLPIGVQVMARKGKEHLLLQLAAQMETSDIWRGMKGNPYFK